MKKLNMAISGIANVDEVVLFREMANQFNNNLIAKCDMFQRFIKCLFKKENADIIVSTYWFKTIHFLGINQETIIYCSEDGDYISVLDFC